MCYIFAAILKLEIAPFQIWYTAVVNVKGFLMLNNIKNALSILGYMSNIFVFAYFYFYSPNWAIE